MSLKTEEEYDERKLLWTLKRNESVARMTFPSGNQRDSCGLGAFDGLSCWASASMMIDDGYGKTKQQHTRLRLGKPRTLTTGISLAPTTNVCGHLCSR